MDCSSARSVFAGGVFRRMLFPNLLFSLIFSLSRHKDALAPSVSGLSFVGASGCLSVLRSRSYFSLLLSRRERELGSSTRSAIFLALLIRSIMTRAACFPNSLMGICTVVSIGEK